MEEQKSKNNVAHIVVLAVLFCAGAAVAMPSQDELDKIAPDVHELMGQYNDDLETGKMTHKDVGDKAVNLAMDAGDDEAAKFLLLKGAIFQYSYAKEYDLAASALETMRRDIKDLPASQELKILEGVLQKCMPKFSEAGRLLKMRKVASKRAKAEIDIQKHLAALKKDINDKSALYGAADAYARLDDWPKACELFARLGIEAAHFELNPSATANCNTFKAAEYWWNIDAQDKMPYKVHAASLYKAALGEGQPLSIVEKGIAEMHIKEIEDAESLEVKNVGGMSAGLRGLAEKSGTMKTLKLPGGVEMEMIYVAPGEFLMGRNNGNEVERPVHKVKLTKGFWLGKYEVTQEQWQSVMGSNPSVYKGNGKRPVENVSWDDCQKFIEKVNDAAKRQFGGRARLPTEAEWEYACRAGTQSDFNNGGNSLEDMKKVGRFVFNQKVLGVKEPKRFLSRHRPDGKGGCGSYHTVVGKYLPNNWGFHDMHGNVMEWCQDGARKYTDKNAINPTGPEYGIVRVLRGGSWAHRWWVCYSSSRAQDKTSARYGDYGMRLCLSAK